MPPTFCADFLIHIAVYSVATAGFTSWLSVSSSRITSGWPGLHKASVEEAR